MSYSERKIAPKNFTQLRMFDLGDDVYLTAKRCENDNTVKINLRQYVQEGNNKPYPTLKGISISPAERLMLETFYGRYCGSS